ncbi:MAG: hypothetical protein A2Y40_08830 [Candidatus Margulisbacteria bacterium GWF2_35_9]|nr:MAG: hypothetical protein A2Y40_08830 [Candidatus Margulisbacteria bacterium GWF2_35_9]
MINLLIFGGLDGIGKNMMAFESEEAIIVLDVGIMFPDIDMYGIDKVIPDFSYLIEKKDKVKCIFITHGHEDHIGAIGYFLEHINVPVYGTKLSLGLIEHKLKERGMVSYDLRVINDSSVVDVNDFQVSFLRVSHSIPDGVMTVIDTPVGRIVHSGDFKVDYTPIDGKVMDLNRIAQIGQDGVMLFLSDSTNALKKGHTLSESMVGESFERVFKGITGRLLVTTFSSNIHRIQQAITVAKNHGRKICFAGLSMENTAKIAKKLGYLNFEDEDVFFIGDVDKYPDNQVLILTTGSQGEPLAALSRIANDTYRLFQIKTGDTVIMSALPIPGNEKTVYSTIDKLGRKGIKVIYEEESKMHVSGHAYQEELKLLLMLLKPQFFIPVHGEYRHLSAHAKLAEELGVVEDILIAENGNVINISSDGMKIINKLVLHSTYIDSNDMRLEDESLIEERHTMANDGVVAITFPIDHKGNIDGDLKVVSKGVTTNPEEFMTGLKDSIVDQYNHFSTMNHLDIDTLSRTLEDMVKKYMSKRIGKRPAVIPIIIKR